MLNKKIPLYLLIIFCICNISLLKEESNEKLLFVLEHFRHGARGAYKSFNYEQWKDMLNEEWKGAGELTSIGMRQHYLLGKSVRNKYTNFIGNTFNPNEISIISTNVNRTLISAYSNLLGMFYNDEKINKKGSINNKNYSNIINNKKFESESYYNNYPIHIYADKDLRYQLYRTEICPGFEQFIKKIKESEGMKKIYKDTFEETNSKFGKYLDKYIDQKIIDDLNYYKYFSAIKTICDTYIADYFDGRVIEELSKTGINLEEFNEHCLNISLITAYYNYYGNPVEKSVEFGISPMFREIFEYMEKRIKLDKENNPDKIISSSPKFVIVSGHDVSLAAFDLFFKNRFNIDFKRADYANNQIFELWKKDGKYYLKYLINLETVGEFEFYDFKDKVTKLLYTDEEIKKMCFPDKYMVYKIENNNNNLMKTTNIIIILIIFILIVVLMLLLIRRKNNINILYHKIIEMGNLSKEASSNEQ